MVENQTLNRIIDLENLKDTLPPFVPTMPTLVAPRAMIHLLRHRLCNLPQHLNLALRRRVRLLAILANRTHQPLRHRRTQGRRHQKRLHANIQQTRHRTRRIVRMQRRKHQVTRQRRLHRNVRRLRITNFANHHDVRRLTQNRTQRRAKVQPHILIHLHLIDTAHLIFNRVLNRNKLLVRRINLPQARIQRRRLPRPRRTRHQHHAVWQLDQPLKRRLVIRQEPELRQTQ